MTLEEFLVRYTPNTMSEALLEIERRNDEYYEQLGDLIEKYPIVPSNIWPNKVADKIRQ